MQHRALLACGLTFAAVLSAPAANAAQAPAHSLSAPSAPGAVRPHPATRSIQIPMEALVNFRDQGGFRTVYGTRVRTGLLFRSESLPKATANDQAAIAALGVTQVIDFRTPAEVRIDGADRLPPGLTATAMPVDDNGMFATMTGAIASGDPVRQEALLGGGKGAQIMKDFYRTLVSSPDSRARFGAVLKSVASGQRVLFHCTAGKDRTGWLGYVLLRSLGVSHSDALADYLASNTFRAAADAKVREQLRAAGLMRDPDLLIPLQRVEPEYLAVANDEAHRRYGSFANFLKRGLGIDARTRAALLRRMTAR